MPEEQELIRMVEESRLWIKFSRCPIGKHRGERWEKLNNRMFNKPAVLVDIKYMWSTELSPLQIANDTFPDWTSKDIMELCLYFYKSEVIFGMLLTYSHKDGSFTTFRPYSVSSAKYYEVCKASGVHVYISAR